MTPGRRWPTDDIDSGPGCGRRDGSRSAGAPAMNFGVGGLRRWTQRHRRQRRCVRRRFRCGWPRAGFAGPGPSRPVRLRLSDDLRDGLPAAAALRRSNARRSPPAGDPLRARVPRRGGTRSGNGPRGAGNGPFAGCHPLVTRGRGVPRCAPRNGRSCSTDGSTARSPPWRSTTAIHPSRDSDDSDRDRLSLPRHSRSGPVDEPGERVGPHTRRRRPPLHRWLRRAVDLLPGGRDCCSASTERPRRTRCVGLC